MAGRVLKPKPNATAEYRDGTITPAHLPEPLMIGLIVAIHRAGGALTVTRAEYDEALASQGAVAGRRALITFGQDPEQLTLVITPDDGARA